MIPGDARPRSIFYFLCGRVVSFYCFLCEARRHHHEHSPPGSPGLESRVNANHNRIGSNADDINDLRSQQEFHWKEAQKGVAANKQGLDSLTKLIADQQVIMHEHHDNRHITQVIDQLNNGMAGVEQNTQLIKSLQQQMDDKVVATQEVLIQTLQNQVSQLQTEKSDMEQKFELQQIEQDSSFLLQKGRLESETAALKKQIAEFEITIQNLTAERDALQQKLKEEVGEEHILKHDNNLMRQQVQQESGDIERLHDEIKELKREIEAKIKFEAENLALKVENAQLKTQLEALQNSMATRTIDTSSSEHGDANSGSDGQTAEEPAATPEQPGTPDSAPEGENNEVGLFGDEY